MSTSTHEVAYLAEGKLYLKRGAMASQLIESTFAQNIAERVAKSNERHGWRNNGMPGQGGMFSQKLIWGGSAPAPETRKVRITGLTRSAQSGSLIYALDTGAIGGLFAYDIKEEYENRLFHRQEFRAHDLCQHPAKELMALSLPHEDGTACVAIMQPGGRGLRPVTEGDSMDQAPSWVPTPDDPAREILVYQTAGIGRNNTGHAINLGPYSICRLDLDNGKLKTLLEDPAWDYLVPRVQLEDGKEILYFIRRPYKTEGHSTYTPLKLLLDIVLFPFRLVRAIFAFLNVFSVFFTQKPLTTAGGPKTDGADTRFMQLHGKWIDTEKAMKNIAKGQPAALVPATWELIRMDPDGKITPLASSVLSFDIAPDGTLIYTNGSEIYEKSPNQKPEKLCAHRMIEKVMLAS